MQAPYVKWSSAEVALVPLAVVTVRSTGPATCAGLTAVTVESFTTLKLAAGVRPNLTPVIPLLKPAPVIVTVDPPARGPAFGETPVTVAKKAPTVKAHVYGTPLTVSAKTWRTPFCRSC